MKLTGGNIFWMISFSLPNFSPHYINIIWNEYNLFLGGYLSTIVYYVYVFGCNAYMLEIHFVVVTVL